MADSDIAGADAGASQKRKRVSRACDQCYTKKDKCDGAQPVCLICKKVGRPCTYERPEKKRGPLQGVRQRLEEQIEALESILGFLLDSFPSLTVDAVQRLVFDEKIALSASAAGRQSRPPDNDTPEVSSPKSDRGSFFPQQSRSQARDTWRQSDLATSVAPFLGLRIPATGEASNVLKEEEMSEAELRDELRRSAAARDSILRLSASQPLKAHQRNLASPHQVRPNPTSAQKSGSSSYNRPTPNAIPALSTSREGPSLTQQMQWSHDASGSRTASPSFSRGSIFPFSQARHVDESAQGSVGSWSAESISTARDAERFTRGRPRASQTSVRQGSTSQLPSISSHLAPISRDATWAPGASLTTPRSDAPPLHSQQSPTATEDLANALALPAELEDEMDNLLDAYFTHFHPLYPFVDKDSLLRWSSAAMRQGGKRLFIGPAGPCAAFGGPEGCPPSGRTALVLAICAVACYGYGSTSSGWSSSHASGQSPSITVRPVDCDQLRALGDDCHARARSLFFATSADVVFADDDFRATRRTRADAPHDLEAVQATMLITIADMLLGHHSRAWVGLGIATRLAQDLQLERAGPTSTQSSNASPSSRETLRQQRDANARSPTQRSSLHRSALTQRQRSLTYHSLFCIETFMSAALGRPPLLRAIDGSVPLPDVDLNDEWALVQARAPPRAPGEAPQTKMVKSRALSTFVAQTELAVIVNDILLGIQLPEVLHGEDKNSAAAAAQSAVEAKINTWAARLHRWRTMLPRHLAIMVQATPGAASLAGPDRPLQPQPCHMWHLSMLCHYSFTLVERAALAAAKQDWSAVLDKASAGSTDAGTRAYNASPSGDKLVVKHIAVSGLTNLWRLPLIQSSDSSGDDLDRRPSGRGDWKRVTIQSPTSTGALPRLLYRFCECFGDSRLPPLAPFFALSAAHLLAPSSGKGSEEWDALEKVAHSGASAWNAAFASIASMLPTLKRGAEKGATSPVLQRPLEAEVRVPSDGAAIAASTDERGTTLAETGQSDSVPFDNLASMNSILDGAHALAYALGLTEAGNVPMHATFADNEHAYLGNFGGAGAAQASTPSSSQFGPAAPFGGLVDHQQIASQTPRSEAESFTDLFDAAGSSADQSALLYHLGLRAPDELRRPSMSGPDIGSGIIPLDFAAPVNFESHPIEGLPLTTGTSSVQVHAAFDMPQRHISMPSSPFSMQHHSGVAAGVSAQSNMQAAARSDHQPALAPAQSQASDSTLAGPTEMEFGDLVDKWMMRGTSSNG
ncbi:c6 transcription factor [Ceraceosorus bombacis]|uniref:C6 transcription factor n=1 Tax=Ceraceosorus bombacis TaxID=401625 RepID=A0A0N7L8S1_9BASI|nr:c6 transcription factor [Ceraceosorus bombacis]